MREVEGLSKERKKEKNSSTGTTVELASPGVGRARVVVEGSGIGYRSVNGDGWRLDLG